MEPERSMIDRRAILALAGGAVTAATRGKEAPGKAIGWKTAAGLNGFASSASKYRKSYPIWEVAEFLARTGFDGVELVQGWPMGDYPPADDRRRVESLRGFWDRYGLRIFSIQVADPGSFDADAAVRARWLHEFTGRARLAHRLGCACIGLWPVGQLGYQSIDRAIEHCSMTYREAARIAKSEGILASFEIEPPFVFNREEHIREILEKARHPNLKTMFDPSHFDLMSGSMGRPHEMLARIGVANIGYVHFTDTDGTLRDGGTSKHLAAGDGHIDVPRSLATLRSGGFRGWVMVDAWEIPDPYDACTKAMKAFREAWE